jgi:hypothetical protein
MSAVDSLVQVLTDDELIEELRFRGFLVDSVERIMGSSPDDHCHDPEVYGFPAYRPNGEPYPDQGYSSYPYD